ncbi:MAG: hypothetical protein OEQ53_00255 [Saprospiraceae bacterium]|nr:hypothetical protein [Saprospiraceae bacterium]
MVIWSRNDPHLQALWDKIGAIGSEESSILEELVKKLDKEIQILEFKLDRT